MFVNKRISFILIYASVPFILPTASSFSTVETLWPHLKLQLESLLLLPFYFFFFLFCYDFLVCCILTFYCVLRLHLFTPSLSSSHFVLLPSVSIPSIQRLVFSSCVVVLLNPINAAAARHPSHNQQTSRWANHPQLSFIAAAVRSHMCFKSQVQLLLAVKCHSLLMECCTKAKRKAEKRHRYCFNTHLRPGWRITQFYCPKLTMWVCVQLLWGYVACSIVDWVVKYNFEFHLIST